MGRGRMDNDPLDIQLLTPSHEDITALVDWAKKNSENDANIIIQENHIDGVYVRSMICQKGALLIGAEHKVDSINILSHGTIALWTESESKVISAPYIFNSCSGLRKIAITLTDVVFSNIFANKDNIQTYGDLWSV